MNRFTYQSEQTTATNNRHMRTAIRVVLLVVFLTMLLWIVPAGREEVRAASVRSPRIASDGTVTWDCVYLGRYPQRHIIANNYLVEKIKWRVLSVEGNRALLLSERILDARPYNETASTVTWETCTLRSWLNGYGSSQNSDKKNYSSSGFIDMAFNSEEQSAIQQTKIVTPANAQGISGGNATYDKVFVLSQKEAMRKDYGFITNYAVTDTRTAISSDYALAKGVSTASNGGGVWWLRTPGKNNYYTLFTDNYGFIYDIPGGNISYVNRGPRPAIYLDLSSNAWFSAGTVSCNDRGLATRKQQQTINVTSEFTKNDWDDDFSLGATAKGKLTYESSDEDVVSVSDDGWVTINGPGTADIIITAASTDEYERAAKKVTVTILSSDYGDDESGEETDSEIGGSESDSEEDPDDEEYPGENEDSEQSGDEDSEESDADREEQIINCESSFTKNYGDEPFSLEARAEGYLTYESSDTEVAEVSEEGIVTINGTGIAVITIRAEATEENDEAEKLVVIIVEDSGDLDDSDDPDEDNEQEDDDEWGKDTDLRAISSADVSTIDPQTYTGHTITPEIEVYDREDALQEGEDYVVIYANNVDAGTAKVIIVGTGNYTGAVTKAFTIKKAPQRITGKSAITKKYGSKSFNLGVSSKTRLSYKSSNKKVAQVSQKGIVTPKNAGKVKLTVTAAETKNYRKAKKTITLRIKLKTPDFHLRWNGKGQIKLTWAKIPGADNYQVYMYEGKQKRLVRKLTKRSNQRQVIQNNIKTNTAYNYKIRACRIVDGKKVYSDFSPLRGITTLK